MIRAFFTRTKMLLDMIKFEHTIFALPFALISVLLASRGLPNGLPEGRTLAKATGTAIPTPFTNYKAK